MFKRFTQEESVSSNSQVKSSVARGIRTKLIEQFPEIEPYMDDILPKKAPVTMAKCSNRVSLICLNNEPLFFQERDGPIFPVLRLLHKYPFFMPVMRVDKGAISFVMNGANIMCRGFTSPGGRMDTPLEPGRAVCIMAEGKKHPLAVGLTQMSTEDIRTKNSGIGVDNMHYVGDGLWDLKAGGHQNVVAYLLAQGSEMEAFGYGGMRALHHSCNNSHEACIATLLERGADANAADELGNTPLHYAAARGILNIVSRLLDGGADARTANHQGTTPLHKAAAFGHAGIVRILQQSGADPGKADKAGLLPLHLAARSGLAPVVKVLVELRPEAKQAVSVGGKLPADEAFDDAVRALLQ